MGLVAKVRSDPELIENTLVGQFLDFPPPDGADRWEDSDLSAVPLAAYLAGFDTVASAASFLLYYLLSNPEYLARVRQEYEELPREPDGHVDPIKQKFLRAAFQETVRINPPGSLVIRYADEDFEFGGYSIRKGDEIIVQIAGDNLNEELFPNPHTFDPTRYLGPDGKSLKQRLLPFGSGAHRCTGSMVGQLLAEEMISYWVNNFDFELVPDTRKPKVVARPFTQPVGLRVKVLGRRSS
jgi:cytochrome P450